MVYGGSGTLNYGTQFTLQGNLTLDSNTFSVPGPSIFSGNVDITGRTDISDNLDVNVGVTTLNVNGTSVNLSAAGNGFYADV